MIYWQNRILTNVKTILGSSCKAVVSTESDIKTTFPACAVRSVTNNSVSDDLDMSDGENAVYCGVSVDAYTKTTQADAMNLISLANKAMYRMGFRRIEGPVPMRSNDSTIFRVTARYARVIGADDVIEKITEA